MLPYLTLEGVGAGPLTLHYDANAVELLQEQTGLTDMTELSRRAGQMDMKVVRAMFWTALRRHHPDISLEQAGALIDGQTLEKIVPALPRAWARFLGVELEPNPPTGSASPSSSTGAD